MLDVMQGICDVGLYVPLTCANDILLRHSNTDLEGEVGKFLNGGAQSGVLLLLGDSGAGKSTFCAHLFTKLRDAYLNGGDVPLPVFIKLGTLSAGVKAGTFVDDELRRHGLDPLAIEGLKKGKGVIFFLDGYDELGEKISLFKKDWLNHWTNAKVIITCRNQHLSKSDDFHLFYRIKSDDHTDLQGFRSLYITPLSDEQVSAYLKEFVKTSEAKWRYDIYQKRIREIYNLRELSSNPMLLNIIVTTMPSLIKDSNTNTINRNRIYTEFIRKWFEDNRGKLKRSTQLDDEALDIDYFFEFAETLAIGMFREGKMQIELPGRTLFDEEEKKKALMYELLTPNNNKYAIFRSGCPIQRVKDNTFTFMHKSYQEYFIARRLQKDISEGSKDALNERSIAKEPAIAGFLSEMKVDNSTLLGIVNDSKTNSAIATAASNAATLLNVRRFSFAGHDLSGVRIPGADLSCAVLDGADLCGADICGVNFRQVFLRNTNLTGSRMDGVEFGEMPYLQGHSGYVRSVAISQDGTKIVSGSDDNTVKVWDMTNGSMINTLQGHSGYVPSVAISPDGTKIVSGSDDNTVNVWDMTNGNMINTLQGHSGYVRSVAISQDGTKIVSSSGDHSVKVWDAKTGRLIWTTNPRLYCKGARINGVTGLSENNWRLLVQKGAVSDHTDH
ncbi:repeat-containing protein [Candidatus Magnetobacterium bavaricum]|uniref:Repeat-containing protein n=1 Tax=Candidatus Magnetobacterium bavaricum TaxID=29290 RepID=A0A0F3GKP2_9BACT|nr:repeat-containing protein [Candidatus Magnetobacterium bavaricum]